MASVILLLLCAGNAAGTVDYCLALKVSAKHWSKEISSLTSKNKTPMIPLTFVFGGGFIYRGFERLYLLLGYAHFLAQQGLT